MEISSIIEDKITELVTAWADEYLEGKPIMFGTSLFYRIKREIEKATKIVKEDK